MVENQNAGRRGRMPLVMAYVPWQQWGELYDEPCGFERGTIFPALYYPFVGREAAER